MKRYARILSLLLTAALFLVLFNGCSANPTEGETNGPVTFRLSLVTAIDDPITIAAKEFAANVSERTEGRVTVEVYPANQLGDATAVFDEIIRGTIDMAYANPSDNYQPDIYLSYLPCLVTRYEDMPAVFGRDGYLFQETNKLYEQLGLKFLGYGTVGFLGIGAAKPILDEKNEIIPGALIRTSSDLLSKLTMEGLGFHVSTMPYVDVFSGLQTGIIDGWLGGNPSINYLSFRDVINYFYYYKIIIENYHFFCNENNFNKMSKEDQEILLECANDMLEQSYQDAQRLDEQYLQELSDFGINVVEFSDEFLADMAASVRENVWPQIAADKYSAELIENLEKSLMELQ